LTATILHKAGLPTVAKGADVHVWHPIHIWGQSNKNFQHDDSKSREKQSCFQADFMGSRIHTSFVSVKTHDEIFL
jgi:hypothetical protein